MLGSGRVSGELQTHEHEYFHPKVGYRKWIQKQPEHLHMLQLGHQNCFTSSNQEDQSSR